MTVEPQPQPPFRPNYDIDLDDDSASTTQLPWSSPEPPPPPLPPLPPLLPDAGVDHHIIPEGQISMRTYRYCRKLGKTERNTEIFYVLRILFYV